MVDVISRLLHELITTSMLGCQLERKNISCGFSDILKRKTDRRSMWMIHYIPGAVCEITLNLWANENRPFLSSAM